MGHTNLTKMGERRGSIKGMTADEARGALTPQQVDDFQAAFNIFDSDGGGEISTRELLKVFKMLGFTPNKDELDEIVEEVDQDGSGEIDFDEFLIMMVIRTRICPSKRSPAPLPTPRPIHRRKRSVCSMTIRTRKAMANSTWTSSCRRCRLPVTKRQTKKSKKNKRNQICVWRSYILGPEFRNQITTHVKLYLSPKF